MYAPQIDELRQLVSKRVTVCHVAHTNRVSFSLTSTVFRLARSMLYLPRIIFNQTIRGIS